MSSKLAINVTKNVYQKNMGLTIDTNVDKEASPSGKSLLATPKASGLDTVLFARKKSFHVPRSLLKTHLAEEEINKGSTDSTEVLAKICHQATKSGKPASPASRHDAMKSRKVRTSRATASPEAHSRGIDDAKPPKKAKREDFIGRLITKFTSALLPSDDEPAESTETAETDSDDSGDEYMHGDNRRTGRSQSPDDYNYLIPRQMPQHKGKKTLVLDLDETLVHSSFKPTRTADFIMPIFIEGTRHKVYVHVRPYLEEFLERMSKRYELVLFTASLPVYANPLCDTIDEGGLLSHRLFRNHCTYHDGSYVKDLSLLGRKMSDIILIDNATYSYGFQPRNGFSSLTWIDDTECIELLEMADYLENIADCKDMRSHTNKWNSLPKAY